MGHVAHQIFGVYLAVAHGLDLQLQHIRHLIGCDQLGTEGEKGGEVFHDTQVAGVAADIVVALQDGLLGHVQDGGIAHDGVLPVLLGHIAAVLAHDDPQLRLGGSLLGFLQSRKLDFIGGANQSVSHLKEAAGEPGGGGRADVAGMVHIVQPDAEDPLRVAVQGGIDHLVSGDKAGDGLQLLLTAGVIPGGQAGDLLLLDQGQHIGPPRGALSRVQGADGKNAVLGYDAGHLRIVPLDSCQSHISLIPFL